MVWQYRSIRPSLTALHQLRTCKPPRVMSEEMLRIIPLRSSVKCEETGGRAGRMSAYNVLDWRHSEVAACVGGDMACTSGRL